MGTILLVCGASADMASLEAVLKEHRHTIIRSRDGRTALDVLRADGAPEIIVVDMAAAGAQLQELLTAARQEAPPVPVILLSEGGARGEGLTAGDPGRNTYVLGSAKVKNLERMITAIITGGRRSWARGRKERQRSAGALAGSHRRLS